MAKLDQTKHYRWIRNHQIGLNPKPRGIGEVAVAPLICKKNGSNPCSCLQNIKQPKGVGEEHKHKSGDQRTKPLKDQSKRIIVAKTTRLVRISTSYNVHCFSLILFCSLFLPTRCSSCPDGFSWFSRTTITSNSRIVSLFVEWPFSEMEIVVQSCNHAIMQWKSRSVSHGTTASWLIL